MGALDPRPLTRRGWAEFARRTGRDRFVAHSKPCLEGRVHEKLAAREKALVGHGESYFTKEALENKASRLQAVPTGHHAVPRT